MAELTVQSRQEGASLVIALHGDGALETAADLSRRLEDLVVGSPPLVVIDLSGVTYMSSMFLGVLVRFRGKLRQNGGTVKLAAMRPDVQKVFETTQLSQLIPVFSSVDKALQT